MEALVQFLSSIYYPLCVALTGYFFLMSLANHYEVWRFTLPAEMLEGPLVSVLVPARNEEKNIERCIRSLLNQFYRNFEILVINDNSTDKTQEILEKLASEDSRIRIFQGAPLPEDWYGKPFALQQLSREAKGEILLFTDADTVHHPTSISFAATNIVQGKVDMVSGFIGQELKSLGEIITVPCMYFISCFIMPLFLNRITRWSFFSAAIGQYIAIKKQVFEETRGFEAFKKKTSEDIFMGRYVKKMGYKTRFLDITEHVHVRMYQGWHNSIAGIGKNIFDFLGKSTPLLLLVAIAVFFFLFFPFALLFFCIAKDSPWTFQIIVVNILYTLTWIFTFLGNRINWLYAAFWPLMYLNLLYMASWSWFRTITGKGFTWKGRSVK